MKYIILSALILNVRCFQILGFLGKIADPCADGLWDKNNMADPSTWAAAWNNCPQAGRPNILPVSATTILLPDTSHPTLNVDQVGLTIVGRNFDRIAITLPAARIAGLCIGKRNQPNRYCVPDVGGAPISACDPAYLPAAATPDFITPTTPFNNSAGLFTVRLTGANRWSNLPTSEAPRPLCVLPPDAARYTLVGSTLVWWSGLTVATVAHCTNDADCVRSSTTASIAQLAELRGQTKCCTGAPTGLWASSNTAVVQTCINDNIESCCGGTPILRSQEKCCSTALQTVAFIDSPCICTTNNDCNITNERCCLRTKYDSLGIGFTLSQDRLTSGLGQCYNILTEQCCNSGQRFDPGSQQCCAISGLQSLEQACPCSTDDQCIDPTGARTNLECCRGAIPSNAVQARDRCDLFSQYPSAGTNGNNAAVQGCLGVCIDRRYQTCCYGRTCIREYEKCCNTTCCNRFVGTCKNARRSAAPGFPSNPNEFRDGGNGPEYLFLQCSTVEHMDTIKGFLLFALPAILLASALSALGLALVFANKSSPRRYSFLERTLIVFAVISVFLILPVFFSPLYKYAEVVVLASIIAVITAAVRVRWLNLFAIIVLAVTVIYIFDPFYGNALLTLAYNRTGSLQYYNIQDPTVGQPDPETSGLLHSTAQLHMNHTQALQTAACTTFYEYFVLDQSLLDLDRRDLRENVTFGYCSRAYVIALLFFEGIAAIFVLLQLVVALLAIIVRFRKHKFDPIELEVMAVPVDD